MWRYYFLQFFLSACGFKELVERFMDLWQVTADCFRARLIGFDSVFNLMLRASRATGCHFNGSCQFARIRRIETRVSVNGINVDERISPFLLVHKSYRNLRTICRFHSLERKATRRYNSRRINATYVCLYVCDYRDSWGDQSWNFPWNSSYVIYLAVSRKQ